MADLNRGSDNAPAKNQTGANAGRKTFAAKRRVLELWCTLSCNENCIMCPTKTASRRFLGKEAFEKLARKYIDEGVKQVNFQGGEPTLIPDIGGYVNFASKIGYKTKLDTNGVRLADKDFVLKLKDAGLGSCLVSLHSMDRLKSETITDRKSTFNRTITGLHRLAHSGIPFTISFVINTLNYDEIPDFVKFCQTSFGGAEYWIAFSFVIPVHHAWNNRERIVPRLAGAMPFLDKGLSDAKALGMRIIIPKLGGIPLCVFPSIHRFREYFDAFAPVAVEEVSDGEELPVDVQKTGLTGGYRKKYIEKCDFCTQKNNCQGIFNNYINIYGDSEFHPMK